MNMADLWAAVAAIALIATAAITAWAARQARQSAEAANDAAQALTAIERDRRHDELVPEFEITCTADSRLPDQATLLVKLTGDRAPVLDSVVVTILDEAGQDRWGRGLPQGVGQEEAEAFVWGPFEFNTGASAQVVSNRETRPRHYSRISGKNWDVLSLRATRPGRWMGKADADWRRERKDDPLRLLLTCEREGYEPWTIQRDVKIDCSDTGSGKHL
ncbi:MAG: hypothetical protein ACYCVZ_00750 [Streptosporangiaceae bacterium]